MRKRRIAPEVMTVLRGIQANQPTKLFIPEGFTAELPQAPPTPEERRTMIQPKTVLEHGTKVITKDTLFPSEGILVKKTYLDARKPNTKATLSGPVPGHGGDIYWATNEDGSQAVYGWPEFELDESGAAPEEPALDPQEGKCPGD